MSKDIEGRAKVMAIIVSVALSVAGNALVGRGEGAVPFLKYFAKEHGEEIWEELVLDPIFGDWCITTHKSMNCGSGRKRGMLQSGVQVDTQVAFMTSEFRSRFHVFHGDLLPASVAEELKRPIFFTTVVAPANQEYV